jgi:hypothetical protein
MTNYAARVASPRLSQDDLLRRLVQAGEREITDIVSVLTPQERARLAFFCYARGHLHDIGLAVAATCDLPFLMLAAPSNAAAHTLFTRSRERFTAAVEPVSRRRPAITLAKSAMSSDSVARMMASMSDDEVDLAAAASDIEPATETALLARVSC